MLRNDTSRVRCSEAIRKKILRIAKELNYRPNPRSLHHAQAAHAHPGFALFQPGEFPPSFPPAFTRGVVQRAASLGYYVSLIHDPHAAGSSTGYALPMSFRELHVDGYIMAHTGLLAPALREALNDPSVHTVFLNDDRPTNAVLPDDREGGRMAVHHAFASGYRRPIFLATVGLKEPGHYSTEHRWEGFAGLVGAGRAPAQRAGGPPGPRRRSVTLRRPSLGAPSLAGAFSPRGWPKNRQRYPLAEALRREAPASPPRGSSMHGVGGRSSFRKGCRPLGHGAAREGGLAVSTSCAVMPRLAARGN